MLIAEFCFSYKCLPDYAINLPAKFFFRFLTNARKIEAYNYLNLADISGVPLGGVKWYEAITERWRPTDLKKIEAIRRVKPNTLDYSNKMDVAKTAIMSSLAATRQAMFGR